jgi:ribose 5-phosphate isomerase A
LAAKLKTIPGIVEHGLFLDLATAALIGDRDDIVVLRAGHPPAGLSQSDIAFD